MGFGHDEAGMMGPGGRGTDQGGSVEDRGRREGSGRDGSSRAAVEMGGPRRDDREGGSADGGLGRRCPGGDEPDAGEVVAIATWVSGEDAPALWVVPGYSPAWCAAGGVVG